MARGLIAVGLVLVVLGLVWLVFPQAFSWFGRLPGDIRVRREGFSFFFPLTSGLLLSAAFSLLFNLLSWFSRR